MGAGRAYRGARAGAEGSPAVPGSVRWMIIYHDHSGARPRETICRQVLGTSPPMWVPQAGLVVLGKVFRAVR